ncbi:CCDC90 family protein [Kineobactrum salinum]|uniref:DUF1640 domain-containing protein n=1 Tax=Kineobactrum salinum TaxID=2708301 RepID=A0A6C0U966_9GAMM|nr:hypothetical protein [Kineobactrum salinum]QIB66154.1 hypothetical protein G3T16_12770 [Kineobactrum salinum]
MFAHDIRPAIIASNARGTTLQTMPQPDFDVLTYSRDLEASGLSRQQAEAIARGMIHMLAQQLDTLVTREHFDVHMARIEQRFAQMEQRFTQIEQRFEQSDHRMDGLDARIGRLERTQAAHTVLLSIITIAVLIPLIQSAIAS